MNSKSVVLVVLVAAMAAVASGGRATPVLKKGLVGRHVYFSQKSPAWVRGTPANPGHSLNMIFAVQQRNVDVLEQVLLDVSNPTSKNFGKHLSLEQVGEVVSDLAATARVVAWLKTSGVGLSDEQITVTPIGDFVHVHLTVKQAEKLLKSKYFHYSHEPTGYSTIRADEYRLPQHIAQIVDYVTATNMFPSVRPRPAFSKVKQDRKGGFPAGYVTPSILFSFYNINPIEVDNNASQSVFESLAQSFNPSDLTQFQQAMNVTVQAAAQVIGPNTPSACAQDPDNCVEASLDIEYIMAVAQGAPTTFWSIDQNDQSPYLDFLLAVASATSPPLVHSISYGEIEQESDPAIMKRFNTEAMKLGARGITVVIASGDDGVANFIARSNQSACGFNPSYPATAPYVTAVGATQGAESNTTEVACSSQTGCGITTGGGFSTYFTQPAYQTTAVSGYLANGPSMPPLSQFNSKGRAYPDVSMAGMNYIIYDGGNFTAGSGTSASAPVFAASISLINSLRMQAGKSSLGFLNQILYNLASTNPSVFNDITSGVNNCCAGSPGQAVCCQYGFTATSGWDPLSGFGTINFPLFSQALLNLP